MSRAAGGRALRLAACLFLGLALALSRARGQEDSKPESFAAVDPYTRGEQAALDRAGYVSFGPFAWCEGVTTDRLATEFGGIPVLWVETPHVRIGSTLATYKAPGDRIERRRVEDELDVVRALFPGSKPNGAKLDPWLRLHLYARRIEDVHAQFLAAFGVSEADFGESPGDGAAKIAPGPHLGMPMKPTVLLCERRSTLARFVRLVLGREPADPIRENLPGGSMFFGISAEAVRSWDQELDAALHAQVAADVALNLVDGFRNQGYAAPVWFKYGWSHIVSRRADERFTLYARAARRESKDVSDWLPRVQGLVSNDFAPRWETMAGWTRYQDIDAAGHLTSWSKVSWMLSLGPQAMRGFLMAVTEPVPQVPEPERAEHLRKRQVEALLAACGAEDLAGAEEAWKRWVAKPGAKR